MENFLKALIAYHDKNRDKEPKMVVRDIMIQTMAFVPAKGWVITYELGTSSCAAFVSVGPDPKVLWAV